MLLSRLQRLLSNGLVEVDGAVDAPQFDRASVEPDVGVAEDDFRLVSTGTPSLPPETITRVASTTLLSNFVGGNQRQVGTTHRSLSFPLTECEVKAVATKHAKSTQPRKGVYLFVSI